MGDVLATVLAYLEGQAPTTKSNGIVNSDLRRAIAASTASRTNMADMTLCDSKRCDARERCRRNQACPRAYPISEHQQSWACWHPLAGATCPGFLDMADMDGSWWDRPARRADRPGPSDGIAAARPLGIGQRDEGGCRDA